MLMRSSFVYLNVNDMHISLLLLVTSYWNGRQSGHIFGPGSLQRLSTRVAHDACG